MKGVDKMKRNKQLIKARKMQSKKNIVTYLSVDKALPGSEDMSVATVTKLEDGIYTVIASEASNDYEEALARVLKNTSKNRRVYTDITEVSKAIAKCNGLLCMKFEGEIN